MREEWLLLLWEHRGKIGGTLLGFLVGWFLIRYGFLKTLIVATATAAGLLVGWRWDGGSVSWRFERLRRRLFGP